MKYQIYRYLSSVKLSSAAYLDYSIAGISVLLLVAFQKYWEALVMLGIAITYNLIARKLQRYGR